MTLKKYILISFIFALPFGALAFFTSEKPIDIEWCDSKLVQRDCYDGISYAYLLEKNIPLSEYPKTEQEFYTLQASYVEIAI